jgi:hypothetical protein
MKKILMTLLVLSVFVSGGFAANVVYDEALVNGAVAVSTNYVKNLALGKTIDYLSYQATYSTGTFGGIVATTATMSVANDTLVSSATYASGQAVLLTTTTWVGTLDFSANTTYYAIPSASGYVKLATTAALAKLGTAVDITALGTSGNIILTPIPFSGTFTATWQCSNDNYNWYTITSASVTTIVVGTAASNYLWDFGFTSYKYIRCAVSGGTWGAINLKLQGYGKRTAP